MSTDYANKKWLITGAGRGIGRALAVELHKRGATVYALSKNPDNLISLKAQCPGISTICVDLTNWSETRNAVQNLEPLDCLVNNAGIALFGGFMDVTQTLFDSMMDVNVKPIFNVSQIVAKKMIDSGKQGSIVNVSSLAGLKPLPGLTAYGCTKAAVELLTKSMALELRPYKIRVNSVCPAAVDTDMYRQAVVARPDMQEETRLMMLSKITSEDDSCMPMSDIVNTILFLGSNATSKITGESVSVDGGLQLL